MHVKPQSPAEIAVEQEKRYLAAEQEFANAPDGALEGWLERKKLATTWSDTGEYRRARRNSVLASFVSILVTHTGLYPTKIPALGVEFPKISKPLLLIFLLLVTWYLTLGMNMLLRGFLIQKSFLEIEQAKRGVYKEFTNRWTYFIDAMHSEKSLYDRRIPNLLCIYASISLIGSLLYMLARFLIARFHL